MVRVFHVDYSTMLEYGEVADGWVYDDPAPAPRKRFALLEHEPLSLTVLNGSSPFLKPFTGGTDVNTED